MSIIAALLKRNAIKKDAIFTVGVNSRGTSLNKVQKTQ
jgi:hypothetical protein